MQAIPRKVWLDGVTMTDLLQWPIEEVESLRMERIFKENIVLKAGSTIHLREITSAQVTILAPTSNFQLQPSTSYHLKYINLQKFCSTWP